MKTRVGLDKIFISAPYGEAVFQICWCHNLVHRRWRLDTPSDYVFCPMLLCFALDRQ